MAEHNNNETRTSLPDSNKEHKEVLYSESGTFIIDGNGIVQDFEPAEDNPFIEEENECQSRYTYTTYKSIRTFIVPRGVKGFVNDFLRGAMVVDQFILPDTLESIGENCFANCILPEVVIPDSVQSIGQFAFGHTYINTLQLPLTIRSPYGRQFKDSHIGTLILPREWKDDVIFVENNKMHLKNLNIYGNTYGYLQWYSTYIGNIEFYNKMTQEFFNSWIEVHRNVIEDIRKSAHELHDSVNQTYDKDKPYGVHLDMVVQSVYQYAYLVCNDEQDLLPLFFGAFYHDSIEDARLTYNDVKKIARKWMDEEQAHLAAEIVYALTNDKGRTRSERAGERYYKGIRETPYAPFVKLADRLANISYSCQSNTEANLHMREVYRQELPHFLQAIDSHNNDQRFTLPKAMVEEIYQLLAIAIL